MNVQIIRGKGDAALVQWTDRGKTKCVTVPRSELRESKVEIKILRAGIPYGEPWSELFADCPGVAEELYRANIYTKEDFKHGLTTVRAILTRTLVNPIVDRLLKEL